MILKNNFFVFIYLEMTTAISRNHLLLSSFSSTNFVLMEVWSIWGGKKRRLKHIVYGRSWVKPRNSNLNKILKGYDKVTNIAVIFLLIDSLFITIFSSIAITSLNLLLSINHQHLVCHLKREQSSLRRDLLLKPALR